MHFILTLLQGRQPVQAHAMTATHVSSQRPRALQGFTAARFAAKHQPRRVASQNARACWRCVQPGAQPLVHRGERRELKARATQVPRQEPQLAEEEASSSAREEASGNETPQQEESLGVRAALALLRFYKNGISPLLPPSCRYLPTCSAYAMEAYQQFGVGRGTVLTAWRLMRCSPFGSSGYDPVRWPPPGLEWLIKE